MSDWNTHLYCANRVNQVLQYQGKDLDLFLFGNILPDVNMGWIITPDVRLEQADTHFDAMGQEYFWAPLRFYEEYREAIDSREPLHMGYLFHLWLDVSFMTYFVSRMPMSLMVSDYHKVRELKWKDAGLFINDYKCPLSPENIDDIVSQAKSIREVNISKQDLQKVVEYTGAGSKEYEGDEYQLFSEKELADFYDRICSDFMAWIPTPRRISSSSPR